MIKLNLKPEPHVLRQFAWIAAVLLPLLAAFLTRGDARWFAVASWQWGHPAVLVLGGLAAAQLLLFLFGVRQLTWLLYAGLSVIAFPIGFVISHVLMAAIYYLVITPIGLVFRLIGRDVLGKRLDRDGATSYWHVRGAPRDAASYFKLY
ncbi:MAG: hypothetical protein MUC36_03000 [Planctomycetes bacterium]|jgi:hypothetical protein|nr:hypothetical protein [Planctomycetota bacterium]